MILALFLLLAMHALCDFPLQGDFLAKAKNHKAPIPGVPWYIALTAHATIQAGGVLIVTGNLWFAGVELLAHAAIDWMKSEGILTFGEDQIAHIGCKVVYALVMVLMISQA